MVELVGIELTGLITRKLLIRDVATRTKNARMPIRLYKICTKVSALTRDQHTRSVAQQGEDIEKLFSFSARESSYPKASNTCFVQVLNLSISHRPLSDLESNLR